MARHFFAHIQYVGLQIELRKSSATGNQSASTNKAPKGRIDRPKRGQAVGVNRHEIGPRQL